MTTGVYNKVTGYHNRRSIRRGGYDYSQPGAYFLTICTHDRKQRLFGDIVDANMGLNDFGRIVRDEWLRSFEIRRELTMDRFIVMPNHIHEYTAQSCLATQLLRSHCP